MLSTFEAVASLAIAAGLVALFWLALRWMRTFSANSVSADRIAVALSIVFVSGFVASLAFVARSFMPVLGDPILGFAAASALYACIAGATLYVLERTMGAPAA